jgi:hypothetical protein
MILVGRIFSTVPTKAEAETISINWTAEKLCTPGMINEWCVSHKATWTYIAPSNGKLQIKISAETYNSGPEVNERLNWSSSNDESGTVNTVPGDKGEVSLDLLDGQAVWVKFIHPVTSPGGSVKAVISGVFEPTPAETETPIPTVTETQPVMLTETPIPTVTETQPVVLTETPIPTVTETQPVVLTETPIPTVTETQPVVLTETPIPTGTNTPRALNSTATVMPTSGAGHLPTPVRSNPNPYQGFGMILSLLGASGLGLSFMPRRFFA